MTAVLHLAVAELRDDASTEDLAAVGELAAALRNAEGARAGLVGASTSALVTATWLRSATELEVFASSMEHMRFVTVGLSKVSAQVWSAAVGVPADSGPPPVVEALWAFALPAEPAAFEWQVRALLEAVERLPGVAACGQTIEERERWRAAGLVCLAKGEDAAFEAALANERPRWAALGEGLRTATVPVIAS